MEKMRKGCKVLIADLEQRDHSEDLAVYGKIILKTILKK
jgi:3,4-dihydroxy-2-butanone 4-phosphate synthase